MLQDKLLAIFCLLGMVAVPLICYIRSRNALRRGYIDSFRRDTSPRLFWFSVWSLRVIGAIWFLGGLALFKPMLSLLFKGADG